MKNTYLQAKLIEKDLIRIMFFSSVTWENVKPVLIVNNSEKVKLHFVKQSSVNGVVLVDFRVDNPLVLGNSYKISCHKFGIFPLDVTDATSFPSFDDDFNYQGNDLGSTYTKKSTKFVLWAPLASKVLVKISKPGENCSVFYEMKRDLHGIFKTEITGDLQGFLYKFVITNNEVDFETTDPYAKGSTLNGKESVVVDFDSLKVNFNDDKLPKLSSCSEAVIYETHVRDFTISSYTDIEHKGKFLGLCEEGRKTKKGEPAGFDYLKTLGITHLQLLPIYDYKTVDEENPNETYNWGYDPAQYFVPEGSYGSSSDPLSRIKDLKALVSTYHKAGIRIVMDVVFNHVFEYENSVFEKIVPNYFFRKRDNDTLTNCSGCGNDLATERPMVRKMIVDTCKFWVKEYGIDGLRFDLMGIIDSVTLKEIQSEILKIKPSFMFYGEGWDMGSRAGVPMGTMGNHNDIPGFAFFNDSFRENAKKYFVGDDRYIQAIKASLTGNCIENFICNARFSSASESLNYVECHDNETVYDFIENCNRERTENENLEILDSMNSLVLLSFGIPFIHMGQEIGQSKWHEGNTYNKGDYYNKFSYKLLEERKEHVEKLKEVIALRKKIPFLTRTEPEILDVNLNITDFDHVIVEELLQNDPKSKYEDVKIVMNPNSYEVEYNLNEEFDCIFSTSKEKIQTVSSKTLMPRSLYVFAKVN